MPAAIPAACSGLGRTLARVSGMAASELYPHPVALILSCALGNNAVPTDFSRHVTWESSHAYSALARRCAHFNYRAAHVVRSVAHLNCCPEQLLGGRPTSS